MEALPTIKEALTKLQIWGSDQRLEMYNDSATVRLGYDSARCEVDVRYESNSQSEAVEDEEGNVWKDYVLVLRINWPAYGSVSLERTSEFIKILERAAQSAFIINALLPPVCRECVITRAEKEARKINNLKQDFITFLIKKGWMKNLRVGAVKICYLSPEEHAKFDNLPTFNALVKNKTFQITIVDQTVCLVMLVSE